MNLASFLHSSKEFNDSLLPLPLAPVYSLPSQKWYFSSPSLVPLKKRKENSSFFKYLESFGLLNQQKELLDQPSNEKILLCLYESKDYLDERIRHIFDKIYLECRSSMQNRLKVRCECINGAEQKKSAIFGLGVKSINKAIQASKKSFKSQTPLNKEHSINWNEFIRMIAKEHMSGNWKIEDQLHIYRLPQGSHIQTSIFNLVCNDNYIVFSNGNQLQVNQHMKTKAIQLSELVRKKIEDYVWKKVEVILQKKQEISDYQMFIKKAKIFLQISTLKIWFYKKAENNQIYVLGLSDLSFKGVQCVIFKDFSFKLHQAKLNDERQLQVEEDVKNLGLNKIEDLSRFGVKQGAIEGREKLKNIREANALFEINAQVGLKQKPKQNIEKQKQLQSITQIQCCCCKNLLLQNEIVNEITGNKIQQVRYLRQIKIGKIEHEPYDFVKVCTQCYQVYLKSYKQSLPKPKSKTRQNNQKAFSFYQASQKDKKPASINKEASLYMYTKIDQLNANSANPTMRRLVRDRSLNLRAKSQLNSSKQRQTQVSKANQQKQQKLTSLTKRVEPFTRILAQNRKKYKTAITTNTQTLELQGAKNKDISKDEVILQRTFTHNQKAQASSFQKEFMPKSKSFKLKGRIPKHVNIINKIIINTTNPDENNANIPIFKQAQLKKWQQHINQVTQSEQSNFQDQKSQKVKKSRDTVINNAIEEYDNISRPSFKKIVYKNHRNIIKRQLNIATQDAWEAGTKQCPRKKSVFSYHQP